MKDYMLTTIDNPYNPFTDFDAWLSYDHTKGYGTLELLARFAKTATTLSDDENNYEIDQAIQEIIDMDPTGLFIRISKDIKIK